MSAKTFGESVGVPGDAENRCTLRESSRTVSAPRPDEAPVTNVTLPGIDDMPKVTLAMSWAVLTEAALSFVGMGTPPPSPALGSMVLDAKSMVATYWWTMAAPGAMIIIFVVGLNLLGDGLRDALDPRYSADR